MSVAEPDPAAASETAPPAAPTGAVARIQSVEIENLRGIKSGKLEGLAPLTILTGPNGSGKSTVLDALDIGGSPNPAEAVRDCVLRRPMVPQGAKWLAWSGDFLKECHIAAYGNGWHRLVDLVVRKGDGAEYLSIVEGKLSYGVEGEIIDATDRFHARSLAKGRKVEITDVEYPTDGLGEVTFIKGIAVGAAEERPLHDILSKAITLGLRDSSFAFARSLFSNAERLDILTEYSVPVVHVVLPDRSVPVQLSGDGAYAALRIGIEFLALDEGVALLEEPEAHLHPAAMVLVARAIVNAVRSGTQVVLTTHSLEFIDRLVDEVGDEAAELLALFTMNLRDGELLTARFPGEDVVFCRDEIGKDLR